MKRFLFPLLLLLLIVPTAFAQRTVTDDEVNAVSKGLYCPVCESEPLDTCGTQACQDWRAEIRQQLSEGRTQEEIYGDFVARYGERVLAQPSAQGLNLVLWLGVPVALVLGGYVFVTYVRSISGGQEKRAVATQSGSSSMPKSKSDNDDYLRQIEEELQA